MSTPLSREELKEGDLVFFKIKSRSITHVGIYLGNNRFAHASSSRGVVLSNLDEPYYKRYFYKGGRLNTPIE
jgi:lipoprotein Spr